MPTARVRLLRIILVAGAIQAVGLFANTAWIFFQGPEAEPGIASWLAPGLVSMAVAMVQAGVDASRDGDGGGRGGPPTRGRQRGHTPLLAGLLVIVLLIGAGGAALAYVGARNVLDVNREFAEWVDERRQQFPGLPQWPPIDQYLPDTPIDTPIPGGDGATDQPVTAQRLATEASRTVDAIKVTVLRVEERGDVTTVSVEVRNAGSEPANLSLFRNCVLRAEGISDLEADPFASTWNQTIAAGSTSRGTIVFDGALPGTATSAELSFARGVWAGFEGWKSLTVDVSILTR